MYCFASLHQQMFKETTEYFLAGPDNELSAVEAHEPTKNRFAD
jgi:hypothetical protein